MPHTAEHNERRLLKLLYAGTIILLLILAYITYANMERYVNTSREVRDYNYMLLECEQLMTTLNEQETGARGFLLSNDSSFLEPYELALERRPSIEQELKTATAESAYRTDVDSLLAQVARVTDMHRLIVLNASRSSRIVAADRERLHMGKHTMDQARVLQLALTERIRLDRRRMLESMDEDGVGSPTLMGSYSILAIIAISMLFWRLSRALHHTEQAKHELRLQLQNLHAETKERVQVQELLQQVLDTSPAGIMTFTSVRNSAGIIEDFTWTSSNRAANQLVGRTDLVGKRLLQEMPENKPQGLFDTYTGVVESGLDARREFHYTGEGMDFWITNHSVKLNDGFLVVFSDVTEQKRAELHKFESERFSLIGQITRTVAHEVRNPLTNIHLALEQLEEDLGDAANEHKQLTEVIDRNLKRIGTLVKDMLESTRKRDVKLGPCDLTAVAQLALGKVQDRLELLNMRSELQQDHGPHTLNGDPELLVLAITNLLVNAVEAMEPQQGHLVLKTTNKEGSLCLEITDNGKGMTPDVRDRLFEPFFSARAGGLGLGLTTARSILNAHQVIMDVISAPGEGTTFRLVFPKG